MYLKLNEIGPIVWHILLDIYKSTPSKYKLSAVDQNTPTPTHTHTHTHTQREE